MAETWAKVGKLPFKTKLLSFNREVYIEPCEILKIYFHRRLVKLSARNVELSFGYLAGLIANS